jgi:hypothetical protein
MTIYSAQHTLGTAASLIVPPSTQPQEVHLHNMTKSGNSYVHVGNVDITLNNSIHIDPGDNMTINLMPSQSLYGISDPSGLKVGVLAVRKD